MKEMERKVKGKERNRPRVNGGGKTTIQSVVPAARAALLLRGRMRRSAAPSMVEGKERGQDGSNKRFKAFRPPLLVERKAMDGAKETHGQTREKQMETEYYRVLYTKRSMKKQKTYHDGVLVVKPDHTCTLLDEAGKKIGQTKCKEARSMPPEATLNVGNWESIISDRVDEAQYTSGTVFLGHSASSITGNTLAPAKTRAPTFRKPLMDNNTNTQRRPEVHVPADAVLLNRDAWTQKTQHPVVLPARLKKILRPHQIDGVTFMYQCTMGLKNASINGCILADEMGLGKTLQALSLIHTMLSCGPKGNPAIRRAIIVCPSSLCNNWAKECRKWFGDERLRPLVVQTGENPEEAISNFCVGRNWPLMIISYELIRKYVAKLAGRCDLLFCDEGHRLKKAQGNQTIQALRTLHCPKRVILTGTPIQNNMEEFYALVDFVNPGYLGELSLFRTVYAEPIASSKDRSASDDVKLLGTERCAELQRRTDCFLLRRAAKINEVYLPPKHEFILFCPVTSIQRTLYQTLLQQALRHKLGRVQDGSHGGSTTQALSVIFLLRQICNHPDLLFSKEQAVEGLEDGLPGEDTNILCDLRSAIQTAFPPEYQTPGPSSASGKTVALLGMLQDLFEHTEERAVVVSSSVRCLDLIQKLCIDRGWKTLRLDGQTDVKERQGLVDRFNGGEGSVFLLSTTAGGAGLNLVGASRLFLFDSSWNPASDLQAMARVWRDGQKREVFIYRLLTAGSIEEKIFQRQIMKGEVAALVSNTGDGDSRSFTSKELKELFILHETRCHTFDIMRSEDNAVGKWSNVTAAPGDDILCKAVDDAHVSFVLCSCTTATEEQDGPPIVHDPDDSVPINATQDIDELELME